MFTDPANNNTNTRVEDGNVADGTLCYFPFLYNGVERTQCVVGGKVSSRPWCGTTYSYDTDGSFGYCVEDSSTYRLNFLVIFGSRSILWALWYPLFPTLDDSPRGFQHHVGFIIANSLLSLKGF